MNQRELIERDQKYIAVKEVILGLMDMDEVGATPWLNDVAWESVMFSSSNMRGVTKAQYHKVLNDMLDDPEIERECNREIIPNEKRWVMREKAK